MRLVNPNSKCWNLRYRSSTGKHLFFSFFRVAEALEHVRLNGVQRFHLEDLTNGRIH